MTVAEFPCSFRPGAFAELALPDGPLRFAWGAPDELGSCAYWVDQARRHPPVLDLTCAESLHDEILFCLLGGYGITWAVNRAAWNALHAAGLTAGTPRAAAIEEVLHTPLSLGSGATRRYRFPAQRAVRLAAVMRILDVATLPSDPLALRHWLTGLPGIGLKTASWIVRNRFADDRVAVIDVHVQRAGLAAGFVRPSWRLPCDYPLFELAFCEVARLGGVRSAALDLTIWHQLQEIGRARHLLIGEGSVAVSG